MSSRFADEIRTPLTFEAAVEEILSGIARGRLRRGDRLPNEGDLAAELGISKPTLRQALRVLERSGVLKVRPGKGGGIFLESELLPFDLVSANVRLETESVVEILRGRRVIETAVTHAASAAATLDDLAELERTIAMLRREDADPRKILRADALFHTTVAQATHNRLLVESMRVVTRQLAPLRDMLVREPADVPVMIEIHRRQLRAMRHREPGDLDAVLDEHFRVLEERFSESLGQSWNRLFGPGKTTVSTPFEPPWQKLARLPESYRAHAWSQQSTTDPPSRRTA